MVKMMIVGRRAPGTTLAAHHHHIRDVHGAMVLRYIAQAPRQAPQRYAQNRVFDSTFRASAVGTDPLALNRDFLTQIWFQDMAQAAGSLQQDFYLTHLKPDEDNFVDQATVLKFAVRERVARETPDAAACFKLFLLYKRAAGCSPDRFADAWLSATAQWARSAPSLLMRRHVQNTPLTRPGEDPAIDGVDEFWVDDAAAAQQLQVALPQTLVASLVAARVVEAGSTVSLLAEESLMFAGQASVSR